MSGSDARIFTFRIAGEFKEFVTLEDYNALAMQLAETEKRLADAIERGYDTPTDDKGNQ